MNPIQRGKIKWPKASDEETWRGFYQSVHTTLQKTLKGSTTSKHQICISSNIFYEWVQIWKDATEEVKPWADWEVAESHIQIDKGAAITVKILEETLQLAQPDY